MRGEFGRDEFMYMQGWVPLLSTWNYHNIVNWLSVHSNIHKTKIMTSGPITSWQIDGETVETVADLIFWGSKIMADGDYNHEIKRRLPLEEKLWST